ncbi:c-type cytochrome [Devosia algicola]|uniref:C-type cytochrome n=1 Tax=Devosia algicola TaxID=3026418 RepID=A0ABY7YMP3_9HYPH|nr:c-type cytochrome [Devosia algicola]WDR02205.1 c-type cytochrome [Devosia algicola]
MAHYPWFWRRVKFGAIVLVGTGFATGVLGALFIWSGLFDVAATSKHPWPVAVVLHYAMERSVFLHAPELKAPDLDNPTLIVRGATHYASGCASCHGAPGQLASPIAQQMTPTPPGLYSAGRDFTPSQLFWIVKHGVKMTPMPAWPAQQRQDEIWAMVAFLKHLPDYNTEAYAELSGWSGGADFLSNVPATLPGGDFNPLACARCHGADGKGRNGVSPDIAGVSASKIVQALRAYRDGGEKSGFMQPVAASLTDAQIVAAADYYATLPTHAGGGTP